ncbi:MAG: TlpA family protein disulfide reductase [Chitinophagales bacterium]|nr:TlpA family protein disulfide reductase [Chitinophagales bacterium]
MLHLLNKKILIFFAIIVSTSCFGQENIADVKLKNTKGKLIDFSEVIQSDKPVIISFWATWCSPCLRELDAISEVYDTWQKETGVTLYSVCVDDARSKAKAVSLAKGKGWSYEILYDPNQDLKRALNVINIPYTFVFLNGKIIYKHTGYSPGSEDILYEKIKASLQ